MFNVSTIGHTTLNKFRYFSTYVFGHAKNDGIAKAETKNKILSSKVKLSVLQARVQLS